MERTFTVTGMTCGHCTKAVEEEVGAVPGITAASADLGSGVLTVQGEGFDEAAVRAAVDEAGYAVT